MESTLATVDLSAMMDITVCWTLWAGQARIFGILVYYD